MARDNGIGKDYEISYPVALTIMAFLTIAMYNVIELTLVIFTTFKTRHGLYFYSLLVATWGIIPYGTGFFFKFYNITSSTALYITLIAVGWPAMITGQSLVLYSRLHLITRTAVGGWKWVLIMIIVNAVICHIPIIVLLYGANSANPGPFLTPYSIYEKVQVTIFFIQEIIISGIYVSKTMQMLRGHIRGRNSRMIMHHLVWVNLMIIALDITLLAIEYAGYYDVQTTYKAAVYSVKLKMEFSILNKLLDLFQGRIHDSSDDPRSRSQGTTALGTIRKSDKLGKAEGKSKTSTSSALTGNGLGNSAYARMDDRPAVSMKDMEVMKTMEVSVESSERTEATTGDGDIEGLRGNPNGIQRTGSLSSSEICIAQNGY